MAKKRTTEQSAEIRVEVGGINVAARSNEKSAGFDQLLERQGAASFVFIPLLGTSKRKRQSRGHTARKKAKLPPGDWYDGELRNPGNNDAIPGVLTFDMRRRRAREIAGTLGVEQFFWGTSGAPVEQHAVEVFKESDKHDWKTMRTLAFAGLLDMASSARNIAALPRAIEESQTNMQRFWQLVAVVLGIAITAGALQAAAVAPTSWLHSILMVLFYPFVIPAVLVGVYLRVLVQKGEEQGRDFTAAEAADNWHLVAPHLLALWLLCWIAIVLLTWLQSVPGTDLPFLGRTSGVTTSFIVCVWMLLPIANSKSVDALFRSGIEAAIAAVVSIFTIKLSLYLTNMLTDLMWGFILNLVRIEIPEQLQQIINFFINIGARVFFVAVLLGYAWARTRKQFTRL